jgi:beta-lactamase regulating signal transducer with metallopeptidase domain
MDIFQMSLSASVMIIAVVMIRALTLHKLLKKTFLVLWGVAVCRLLIPFSISSRFSFYTGIDMVKRIFAKGAALSSPAGMTAIPDMANTPGMGEAMGIGASAVFVSPLEIVWLAGMCACALFFTVAYIKCRREFRMSLPVENDFTTLWLCEHSLRRPVQIRQSDRIKAPLTYGVFRPVILLPKKTDWTDETKLCYILTHELTHIRRFDMLTKLVLTAAVCVHWFNPFVWVMYVLANRDLELSCDETVVRTFGETVKSAYALTLIGLEEKKSRITPLMNNFSKNAIEERIVSIMKLKKTSLAGICFAFVLVVGTVTVFATNAAAAIDDSIASVSATAGGTVMDDAAGNVSTDGGKTWISKEEYEEMYPAESFDNVEWYSYDEYKAFVDEQKKSLPNYIGATGGYYDEAGVLHEEVWTQEKVDETLAGYEQILEDIKNGGKFSKSVNGDKAIGYSAPKLNISTSAIASIALGTGKTVDFGPYDTKEECYAAIKAYCDEQVKAGNMTQQEADGILSKYE